MQPLHLPEKLLADLEAGRRPLSAGQRAKLSFLLNAVETPLPAIYDFRGIGLANRLWSSQHVSLYIGRQSSDYQPGDIDPKLTCIIGHAEPDSPIALDYRTSPPRVVYMGQINNESVWIQLAPDYETFIQAIS